MEDKRSNEQLLNEIETLHRQVEQLKAKGSETRKLEARLKETDDELKKTQSLLIQSGKMVGIGQLAAGVAHEINNPLTYIVTNLGFFKYYLDSLLKLVFDLEKMAQKIYSSPDQADKNPGKHLRDLKRRLRIETIKMDLTEVIEESLEGAYRIKDIVRSLLSFSHPDKDEFRPTNINMVIEKSLSVVWYEIRFKCKVAKDFGSVPDIVCNPGELSQVFMNLVMNAYHSIENKGTVKIKSYQQDHFVFIEFADDGVGIPKECQDKIFDPFFTTKQEGVGTGLGLALVYRIIKKHNGTIEVKSKVGEGTTFTIKLPIEGPS